MGLFACFSFKGTMSGGGNKVVKGRMGSSIMSDVNPDQLEAMEKTLEKETKAAEVQNVVPFVMMFYTCRCQNSM